MFFSKMHIDANSSSELNETLNGTSNLHNSLFYCLDRPYMHTSTYGGPVFVYSRAVLDAILVASVIFLNTALIAAIHFFRRNKRGSTRVWNTGTSMKFVQMLAFSDVMVGMTVPMYLIPHYFCDVNDLMRNTEVLCMVKYAATTFSALMSNFSLICIAVDRFIAIQYTMKYRIIMTHRLCHSMMLGTFVFSMVTSSVLYVWNQWQPGTYCDVEESIPIPYMMVLGTACHGGILVTVLGVHVQLHRIARDSRISRRSIVSISTISSNVSSPQQRMSKETSNSIKSAKVVVLVAGVYFTCWTPYCSLLMVRIALRGLSPFMEFIFQIIFPLSVIHSLANPFIYAWKNSEIQAAVKWSCKRAWS